MATSTNQTDTAKSAKPAKSSKPMWILGIAAIAVVIIAVGVFLVLSQHTSSGSSSGPLSTISSSSSSAGSGLAISQAQAVDMLGPGGTFTTNYTSNATLISQLVGSNSTSAAFLKNNVSAIYLSTYLVNGTTNASEASMINIVEQSNVASYIYARQLATNQNTTLTAVNATVDGFTYSGVANAADLLVIGYKGNYVSIALIINGNVNLTSLAGIAAQNLP